jgi:hypothetical protein
MYASLTWFGASIIGPMDVVERSAALMIFSIMAKPKTLVDEKAPGIV